MAANGSAGGAVQVNGGALAHDDLTRHAEVVAVAGDLEAGGGGAPPAGKEATTTKPRSSLDLRRELGKEATDFLEALSFRLGGTE